MNARLEELIGECRNVLKRLADETDEHECNALLGELAYLDDAVAFELSLMDTRRMAA